MRDVGGLPLRDGGHTRPGVLLRSASLHYVTPADVEHLVDVLGLKLVLDLRTRREVDRDGPTAVARAGVETVWLSFMPEDGEPLPRGRRRPRPGAAQLPRLPVAARRERGRGGPPAGRAPTPVRPWCTARRARTGPGCWWRWCWTRSGCSAAAVLADYVLSAEQVAGDVPALDHGGGGADARRPHPAPAAGRGDGHACWPGWTPSTASASGGCGRLAARERAGRRRSRSAARAVSPPDAPVRSAKVGEQPAPSSRRPRWT